ncbi:MAG: hypothetical protein JWR80_9671 [Bradyrhizobium sp.]|nr:hypothetical protein [Bradyrhizobium sp.]
MTVKPTTAAKAATPDLPPTAAGQIEIWKKIVDVQQHFNDLELRIRNFALAVTGAFLGLGGYAIKDGGVMTLVHHEVSIAGLVVFCAIFPLFAFYFMDRLWYHRLLDGSVKAGIDAESALKALGFQVDLGTQVSIASPFKLWVLGWQIHSKRKMDLFYGTLTVTLLIVAAFLGYGVNSQASDTLPGGAAAGGGRKTVERQESPEVMAKRAPNKAARDECEAILASIYGRAKRISGATASDSTTGQNAILVKGQWVVMPRCP